MVSHDRLATCCSLVLLLAVHGRARAEPPPEASLVVWPLSRPADGAARALADRAAERGAFEVVDAGLVQRRVAAGGRVDVASFLGEVRRNVAAASAALGTGDPQGAIDRIEPLLRDYMTDLGTPEGRETLRDLLVVRGRALLERNDPVGAAADVALAVRLDAAGGEGIDRTALLPAERALVDRVVQEAASADSGHLSISSEPPGAAVVVDGAPRGNAPLELDLPYGRHVVRVDRFGRRPAAEIVEVAAGGTVSKGFELALTEGADLLEQIAVRVARGAFDASDPEELQVLARALGARAVLVVEAGPRIRARLLRDGAFVGSGSADPTGPWDELLARLERAALGRTGRTPGPPPPEPAPPLTSRWWFWTAIGGVVVAGAVTAIVVATRPDPLGEVRWGRP